MPLPAHLALIFVWSVIFGQLLGLLVGQVNNNYLQYPVALVESEMLAVKKSVKKSVVVEVVEWKRHIEVEELSLSQV